MFVRLVFGGFLYFLSVWFINSAEGGGDPESPYVVKPLIHLKDLTIRYNGEDYKYIADKGDEVGFLKIADKLMKNNGKLKIEKVNGGEQVEGTFFEHIYTNVNGVEVEGNLLNLIRFSMYDASRIELEDATIKGDGGLTLEVSDEFLEGGVKVTKELDLFSYYFAKYLFNRGCCPELYKAIVASEFIKSLFKSAFGNEDYIYVVDSYSISDEGDVKVNGILTEEQIEHIIEKFKAGKNITIKMSKNNLQIKEGGGEFCFHSKINDFIFEELKIFYKDTNLFNMFPGLKKVGDVRRLISDFSGIDVSFVKISRVEKVTQGMFYRTKKVDASDDENRERKEFEFEFDERYKVCSFNISFHIDGEEADVDLLSNSFGDENVKFEYGKIRTEDDFKNELKSKFAFLNKCDFDLTYSTNSELCNYDPSAVRYVRVTIKNPSEDMIVSNGIRSKVNFCGFGYEDQEARNVLVRFSGDTVSDVVNTLNKMIDLKYGEGTSGRLNYRFFVGGKRVEFVEGKKIDIGNLDDFTVFIEEKQPVIDGNGPGGKDRGSGKSAGCCKSCKSCK